LPHRIQRIFQFEENTRSGGDQRHNADRSGGDIARISGSIGYSALQEIRALRAKQPAELRE